MISQKEGESAMPVKTISDAAGMKIELSVVARL
jgi:hypothetical protein